MPSDKPLHVEVAEALGWTNCRAGTTPVPGDFNVHQAFWLGDPPPGVKPNPATTYIDNETERVMFGDSVIPHYDTDWSVTGPLIKKFGFNLDCVRDDEDDDDPDWEAFVRGLTDTNGGYIWSWAERGATNEPLVAICYLILTLAKKGKLR